MSLTLAAEVTEKVDNILCNMKDNDLLYNVEWDVVDVDDYTIKIETHAMCKGGHVKSVYNKEDMFHAAVIVGNRNGNIPTGIAHIVVGKTMNNLAHACHEAMTKRNTRTNKK